MNVDWQRIESFADEDDPEDVEWLKDMLKSLIENTEERLGELNDFAQQRNFEKIRTHLHQLKGVAANFGLNNFRQTCIRAESMVIEGQQEESLIECQKLPPIWLETKKELQTKYF